LELVTKALVFATMAHHGQVDLAGEDYIRHPLRVAERLKDEAPEVQAAAWLHDVIEDTEWTAARMLDAGFPVEVVDAVVCLTKIEGETRTAYYERVKTNPIALKVKLADIADNADPDRLAVLPVETAERLAAKYAAAEAVLTS
jgi:(p)ppGpp synthase/HD superfamily hydrolase